MYLRPRGIFEKFCVAERKTRLDEIGRTRVEFEETDRILFGVISTVSQYEREKFSGLKHEVTHQIIQKFGSARAQVGDMLIKGTRKFLIQTIENPAGVGQFLILYVCERFDI